MGKQTLWNKMMEWIGGIEYRIAKRWLDKNFGEKEYWGEYIAELQSNQRRVDSQYKQIQDNIERSAKQPFEV